VRLRPRAACSAKTAVRKSSTVVRNSSLLDIILVFPVCKLSRATLIWPPGVVLEFDFVLFGFGVDAELD
jgi:hypothetical protein